MNELRMNEYEKENLTQRLRNAMDDLELKPNNEIPGTNLDTQYLYKLLDNIES